MYEFHKSALIFLAICTALWLVCCGGGGANTSDTTPNGAETGDEGGSQSASRGQQLLEDRCDRCHGVDTVYAESFDREGWIRSINSMVARGAELTEEERDIIVEYLLSRGEG